MKITSSLLILLLILGVADIHAQTSDSATEKDPSFLELKVGLSGTVGIHRLMGQLQQHYHQTSSHDFATRPEVNKLASLGLVLQFGKPSSRISGQITAGLALQQHHWQYDWETTTRSGDYYYGTQKVAEQKLVTDFALRLKWSSKKANGWTLSIGAFAGNSIIARSRSYVKLERGNIIQPQTLDAPVGPLLQISRKIPGERLDWEPFVECRYGLNWIITDPSMRSSSLNFGATFWIRD